MSASVHAGIPSLPQSRHPPGVGKPPSPQEQTPLVPGPPPSRHPPGPDLPPPEQSMLGDTVNERVVRILLECNLVFFFCCFQVHLKFTWKQLELKNKFYPTCHCLKLIATKLQNVSISYSEISHVRDEQAFKVQGEITPMTITSLHLWLHWIHFHHWDPVPLKWTNVIHAIWMNSFQQLNSRYFVKISVIICNCTVNVVMYFVVFLHEMYGPCLGKRSLSIPWRWHLSQRSHKAKVAQLVSWRHCLFLIMNSSAVKLGSLIHAVKQSVEISFNIVSLVTASKFVLDAFCLSMSSSRYRWLWRFILTVSVNRSYTGFFNTTLVSTSEMSRICLWSS